MLATKSTYQLNIRLLVGALLLVGVVISCKNSKKELENTVEFNHPLLGEWVKIGHGVSASFIFKNNGLVEGDFGGDNAVDVIANYEISRDTIKFVDKKGQNCEGTGSYKMHLTDYYVAFDLIEDNCGGRIKSTMGFWVRPDFKNTIEKLNKEIASSESLEMILNRARVYLAIGKPKEAKEDLDKYIATDSSSARVYVNRASTRFPHDMEGVIYDCDKAIELEPGYKNAYFLRGLARYQLGEQELACKDFEKAIELVFSILRTAEQNKCSKYWSKN